MTKYEDKLKIEDDFIIHFDEIHGTYTCLNTAKVIAVLSKAFDSMFHKFPHPFGMKCLYYYFCTIANPKAMKID
jgi:hypothetical protein